ncbi:MAG: DUF1214 domain-containing protein [Janthinobacterium lividum]
MNWEDLIDQLRPLGQHMIERLPPRLRDDPQARAEGQRLLLAATMRAISDVMVGDRAHPMFVPELNIALNLFQPNSDTIYKSVLIGQGGRYRIRGERGSIRVMRMAQLGPDTLRTGQHSAALLQHDFDALTLDDNGCFDVLLSVEKPDGHQGDWWQLDPKTEKFMIRFVSYDWGVERDPRMSIDRLDTTPMRPRLSAEDLHARYDELPTIIGNASMMLVRLAEKLRDEGYINRLKEVDFGQMSGLARQSYYEGAYDLADDEALLVEARVPANCGYWSLILTNEIYETTDWYNNQSSLNGAQARLDADGQFRAVICARDPGVPNWLDTSGYPRGAVQGRWLDCDESPLPIMRKVLLSDVRGLLPADTPSVSPAERELSLRERRHGAQMRTIW